MSTLFTQSAITGPASNDQALVANNQPEWFQNQKKRTIPNHLVPKKKTGFHINSSVTNKSSKSAGAGGRRVASGSFSSKDSGQVTIASKDQFNIMSFGSQQRKAISQGSIVDRNSRVGTLFDTTGLNDTTRFDDTINETYEDFGTAGDDLPPSRSIYDLNDEILVSLNKPAQQIDSFINKDPKDFANVFNRQDDSESSNNATAAQERRKSINPLTNNESAVLIFGYPESLAPQVIQHFKEFGDVLEDFDSHQKRYTLVSTKNPQRNTIVPIFSGKNWIKVTYDNPGSALEALQDNGSVFNGILLGVIPYSKHSIEKLQKRTLVDSEDIGGGNITLNDLNTTRNEINNGSISPGSAQTPANTVSNNTSYTSRLDIKDGSQFFLKSEGEQVKSNGSSNEKPLGIFGTISKYVFGFHEL
ncbi:MPPN-domain-containing protein [Suhomyces tanzawaensis NRRL Y-17324]|uniref:MPPN-domain-containing protein n=1 Tax=Suhomyces tanzawaensis NRRL Y-17324 TaxID=984487 RepID=A0A1E4SFA3_9ASCO|nr:MPPN-domain-containing protein [Suhomyces tanzawaensis NRRL Y-17324]ODV78146.1 MPPN-domain-containing protein [Suhomyces tanzawaensis NRRL Y-17324]